MPMTGSTIYGAGTFSKVFGLISSASTDGTALSLTIAHGISGLDATTATQILNVSFEPQAASGATAGWFVATKDGTNVVFGRDASSAGAAATATMQAVVRFNHTLIR